MSQVHDPLLAAQDSPRGHQLDRQPSSFFDDSQPPAEDTSSAPDVVETDLHSHVGSGPAGDPSPGEAPAADADDPDMSPFNIFNKPKVDQSPGHAESGLDTPEPSDVDEQAPVAHAVQISSGARLVKQPPMPDRPASQPGTGSTTPPRTSPARTRRTSPSASDALDPYEPPTFESAFTLAIKIGPANTTQPSTSSKDGNNLPASSTLSLADTLHEDDKSSRKSSRGSVNSTNSLARKIFTLTHHGYILQYADRGPQDRLPEKIQRLTTETYAIASDLVPGRPYTVEIAETGASDVAKSDLSLLKRMGMKNSSTKKLTTTTLIVLDNAKDLEDWLSAIRIEIQKVVKSSSPPSSHNPPPVSSLPPFLPPLTGISASIRGSWGEDEFSAARADSPQQLANKGQTGPVPQSPLKASSSTKQHPVNFIADEDDTSDESEDIDDVPTVAQLYHQQVTPSRLSTSTTSSHHPARDSRSNRTRERASGETIASSVQSLPNLPQETSPESKARAFKRATKSGPLPASRQRGNAGSAAPFSDSHKDSLPPLSDHRGLPAAEDDHRSKRRTSRQLIPASLTGDRHAQKGRSGRGHFRNTTGATSEPGKKAQQLIGNTVIPASVEKRSGSGLARAVFQKDEYHAFLHSSRRSSASDDDDDEALDEEGVEDEDEEEEDEDEDDEYHAFQQSLSVKTTRKSSSMPRGRTSHDRPASSKDARILGTNAPTEARPSRASTESRNHSSVSISKILPPRLPIKPKAPRGAPPLLPPKQPEPPSKDLPPNPADRSPLTNFFGEAPPSQHSGSNRPSVDRGSLSQSDLSMVASAKSNPRDHPSQASVSNANLEQNPPADLPPAQQTPMQQQPTTHQQPVTEHEYVPHQQPATTQHHPAMQHQPVAQYQAAMQQSHEDLSHPMHQLHQHHQHQHQHQHQYQYHHQQTPQPPPSFSHPTYAQQPQQIPQQYVPTQYFHGQPVSEPQHYYYQQSQAQQPYVQPQHVPHPQMPHIPSQPPAQQWPQHQHSYEQSYGGQLDMQRLPVHNDTLPDPSRDVPLPIRVDSKQDRSLALNIPKPAAATADRTTDQAPGEDNTLESPSLGLLPGNIPFMPPTGRSKSITQSQDEAPVRAGSTGSTVERKHESSSTMDRKHESSSTDSHLLRGAKSSSTIESSVTAASSIKQDVAAAPPPPVEEQVLPPLPKTSSTGVHSEMDMRATVTGPVDMFLLSDFSMPAVKENPAPPPQPTAPAAATAPVQPEAPST